jgi:hypothetical protein
MKTVGSFGGWNNRDSQFFEFKFAKELEPVVLWFWNIKKKTEPAVLWCQKKIKIQNQQFSDPGIFFEWKEPEVLYRFKWRHKYPSKLSWLELWVCLRESNPRPVAETCVVTTRSLGFEALPPPLRYVHASSPSFSSMRFCSGGLLF